MEMRVTRIITIEIILGGLARPCCLILWRKTMKPKNALMRMCMMQSFDVFYVCVVIFVYW